MSTRLVPPRPAATHLLWLAHKQGVPEQFLAQVVLAAVAPLGAWHELDLDQQSWCMGMTWAAIGFLGVGMHGADKTVVSDIDLAAFAGVRRLLEGHPFEVADVTPQELTECCARQRASGPNVDQLSKALLMLRRMPGWDGSGQAEAG
ncbi:MAG: hypothetical protein RLZZ450_2646 [Pseudomonadota bacterium]|jgi:hypothetical protein